jgi:hypothetical protein
MALRAIIALKKKAGEPLSPEELEIDKGDAEALAKTVAAEAK